MFGWFRRRRRRKLLASPVPDSWGPWLEKLHVFLRLDDAERDAATDIARVMIAEKLWEGCDGLELTEEMQVVIAVQAAVMLIGLPHDHFARTHTILVYPGIGFRRREEEVDYRHYSGLRGGEAWHEGAVIFAWDCVHEQAYDYTARGNVVLHEFAHRLDMQDGWIDNTPMLWGRVDMDVWQRTMRRSFEEHAAAVAAAEDTLLDPYGASSEAEFLPVLTECFFLEGDLLATEHPDLYAIMRDYFRQDPAARLERDAQAHEDGA